MTVLTPAAWPHSAPGYLGTSHASGHLHMLCLYIFCLHIVLGSLHSLSSLLKRHPRPALTTLYKIEQTHTYTHTFTHSLLHTSLTHALAHTFTLADTCAYTHAPAPCCIFPLHCLVQHNTVVLPVSQCQGAAQHQLHGAGFLSVLVGRTPGSRAAAAHCEHPLNVQSE